MLFIFRFLFLSIYKTKRERD